VALNLQTRYAGNLPGCTTGPDARATLVRVGDHFSFAPSDGVLIISGTVAPDGSFSGSLITAASRHDEQHRSSTEAPPFTLSVTGRLEDDAATGTYLTPRCSAAFRLPRIGTSLMP
jgi:hypothetical protein